MSGVPPDQDAAFRAALTEVEVTSTARRAAGSYTFTIKPNIAVQLREDTVNQALQTIERRVNELGVAEPIVARHSAADQILVQLPGVTDVARAKEIIRSTAQLELKLVEQGPFTDEAAARAGLRRQRAAGHSDSAGHDRSAAPASRPTRCYYVVRRVPAVTGRDLRNARPSLDENNRPAVSFTLNNDGARKFGTFTRRTSASSWRSCSTTGSYSAPQIQRRIDDEGHITGSFTKQEAQDLSLDAALRRAAGVAHLSRGAHRRPVARRRVDPRRRDAAAGGLLLVMIFMLFYYQLAGFNALISIVVNLIILLGLMAYLGAMMTLPGIAGFILTIGMGVDSNVLIFERIKEELRPPRASSRRWRRASIACFLTILDTHVASLICGGVPVPVRHRPDPRLRDHADHRAAVERVHGRVRVAHHVRAGAVAPPGREALSI